MQKVEKKGIIHSTERVVHTVEPIRLFRSNFLEFFSHISPKLVVGIWLPTVLFFAGRGLYRNVMAQNPLWGLPIMLFAGWFIWTFAEYVLHRFIFHYHPKTERLKRFFFTFHGVHHAQPMCKSRLVMPPAISAPLSMLFYGLFYAVVAIAIGQPLWLDLIFSGFLLGYLAYDLVHYTLHHSKSKNGYLAMCRRQHMRHHVKCPNMRFGVSIPLWDYLFGTMPPSGLKKKMTAHDQG